jgi:alpha-L-fucosidase
MTKDLKWFTDARFGMFIHWGLYALPGGIWQGQEMAYIGEWLQSAFRIPNAEYETLASEFNPLGFDADDWVRTARESGMRHIVFTAKHHDGFAMYHSRCSSFNIVDATPFGRDVLAELAAACGKYDMKLGVYYSQDLDWHDPDGGDPGPHRPKNQGMSWGNDWDYGDYSIKDHRRYVDRKVIPQLTELLSNYGPIAVVWFDCPLTISRADSERIFTLIAGLQPQCLVNTRLGNGFGDFGSLGDNQIPASGRRGIWETPGTLNDTWGFKYNDHNWKSPDDIIRLLADLASKDTNYLLNIGPGPDGRFPDGAMRIFNTVGQWLKTNGAAIYRTSGNPFPYGFQWGSLTVTPGSDELPTRLNLLLRRNECEPIRLDGLKDRVVRCHAMSEPTKDIDFTWTERSGAGSVLIRPTPGISDPVMPVLVLELNTHTAPRLESRLTPQNGNLSLLPVHAQLVHGIQETAKSQDNLGAAGERLSGNGHSYLDPSGTLAEWHNPEDSAVWEIMFPEPGTFLVELTTTSRRHSAPWVSGQKISLAWDDGKSRTAWVTELSGTAADSTTNRYYRCGTASAGNLSIAKPGSGTLSLKMLSPGSQDTANMVLNAIKLTRIESTLKSPNMRQRRISS